MKDIERKVYQIVRNIDHMKSRPAKYYELLQYTGLNEIRLNEVLEELVNQEYIRWDKHKTKAVALRNAVRNSPFNNFTN